ncbi:MAG TPA: tetratricopeptide repeat protein [Methylomirabilota bacterium]|nr:tetratricopeptide repeat protein [Methylomirabilota bacterium]
MALASCGPGGGERAQEHVKKGTALIAEGKYDAAVTELQKAVELNKDSIEGYTELGNAYRGLKQYDKAVEAYRAAKKVDRYVTRPHLENAKALVEMGQIEAAIDELNHVIELDSKNLEAMLLLGRVSIMPRPLPEGGTGVPKASLERAELNLETAVQLAPDNLQAYHELALVREKLGKKDKAKEAWARVRDLAAGQPGQAALAAEAAAALERLKR